MLHKINVRIDAGKLKEQPLLPEILQVLKVVRPAWLPENICSKLMPGGISNALFAYYEEGQFEKDVVLLRIEGEGSDKWMYREEEKRNMQVLHEAGCCVPLYAEFDNGIAYGYVYGETIDINSVRDEKISKLIAKELCRLHAVTLKPSDKAFDMRTMGDALVSMVPEGFPDDPEKHKRYIDTIKSKHALQEEYTTLRDHLETLGSPKVFCHNDLIPSNIIYNKDKDRVQFIDVEFATYNYEHYDIAQHFCEYVGVKDFDYTKYPDKEYQLEWIKNYLCYKAEINGGSQEDVSENDVEEFYVICSKFALIGHLLAGVWGFVQATVSKLDYDYLNLGLKRLGEYYTKKDEFLALQVPQKI